MGSKHHSWLFMSTSKQAIFLDTSTTAEMHAKLQQIMADRENHASCNESVKKPAVCKNGANMAGKQR